MVCGTIEGSCALVLPEDFQPDQVYPGARAIAGDEASAQTDVTVLGTDLFETTGGAVKVLVIFERGGNARD